MKILLRIYTKFNIAIIYNTSTKQEETVDLDYVIKIFKKKRINSNKK